MNWNDHKDGNSGSLHHSDGLNRYEAYYYNWNGKWFADFWTSKNKWQRRFQSELQTKEAAISTLEYQVGFMGQIFAEHVATNNNKETVMQSNTIDLKDLAISQELEGVRPDYADVLMNLWEVVCKPVLRFGSYFQRMNTKRFVKAFEARYPNTK